MKRFSIVILFFICIGKVYALPYSSSASRFCITADGGANLSQAHIAGIE